jgi:hypothetical protein
MPDAAVPVVVELARLDYRVSLGNMTTLASAAIYDVDPVANPTAPCTLLAALTPGHHAKLTAAEDQPSSARPTYFARLVGGLELWPRADKAYWFRATYRAALKVGAA